MPAQNLLFNIVTFDFPKVDQCLYFSKIEEGRCHRLHWTLFPKDIESIFPGIKSSGTEFIYTTYNFEKEGFLPLVINFSKDNPNLVKKFYNRKVFLYFKKELKTIAKQGFINETIVWLPSQDKAQLFNVYDKFSIRVQLCTVSKFPELLISYDGKARVYKQSVSQLIKEYSPGNFNFILQDNNLFKYAKMEEFEDPDYETAFPIMNNKLRKAMKLATEVPIRGNRYPKYWGYIQNFYNSCMNTKGFKSIIPLHDNGFIKVAPVSINTTNDSSNDLSFSEDRKGRVPKLDIRKLKPYKISPWNKIHLFFIVHNDDVQVAIKLNEYFINGLKWFDS